MSRPPKIWSRFSKVCNGKEVKFRIQELPDYQFEEMMDLIYRHFAPEESVHKASKLTQNEQAFTEYKEGISMLIKEMNYQIDVCCLDGGSEDSKIVGASIMVLEKRNDTLDWEPLSEMVQSQEMKRFFKMVAFLAYACNVIKKYNLDLYFDDRAIVVHSDYRRLGMAGELFKARVVACKEHGVPMTGAWMTAIGTQKAAAKLGWETICELNFKDLGEIGGVTFDGDPPSCKLMVIKVLKY